MKYTKFLKGLVLVTISLGLCSSVHGARFYNNCPKAITVTVGTTTTTINANSTTSSTQIDLTNATSFTIAIPSESKTITINAPATPPVSQTASGTSSNTSSYTFSNSGIYTVYLQNTMKLKGYWFSTMMGSPDYLFPFPGASFLTTTYSQTTW